MAGLAAARLGGRRRLGVPADAAHSQIVPELAPAADEAVFEKLTMSAFEGTPLDTVLRDCGVTSVAIVGVALEIGIEPTARHAADLGYVPVVIRDACGAWGCRRRRLVARGAAVRG